MAEDTNNPLGDFTVKSVDGKEVKQEQPKKEEQTPQTETKDAVQEQETTEVPVGEKTETSEQVVEEVREQSGDGESEEPKEEPVIELVEEEPAKEEVKEKPQVAAPEPTPEPTPEPQRELPEDIEKLVTFMEETGGSLEDYANLNKSYDDMSDDEVVREFYKQTKPHLNQKEIDFLLDDKFGHDDDAEEREKLSKQLAWKEELYNARQTLKGNKDKYYRELKFNRVAPEFQEAKTFYDDYSKQQESTKKLTQTFLQRTDDVFKDLKGFDFKVGDKKYRYRVNDVESTKKYQSDLNNFVKEFLGEDGSVTDAAGYHKAMFAAKNADKVAQHFYEQGRADAIRETAKESKNIDMKAQTESVVTSTGTKFKVLDDSQTQSFKLNI